MFKSAGSNRKKTGEGAILQEQLILQAVFFVLLLKFVMILHI